MLKKNFKKIRAHRVAFSVPIKFIYTNTNTGLNPETRKPKSEKSRHHFYRQYYEKQSNHSDPVRMFCLCRFGFRSSRPGTAGARFGRQHPPHGIRRYTRFHRGRNHRDRRNQRRRKPLAGLPPNLRGATRPRRFVP